MQGGFMTKQKEIKIELVNQPNGQLLPVWIGQRVISRLKTLADRLTVKSDDILVHKSKSIDHKEDM